MSKKEHKWIRGVVELREKRKVVSREGKKGVAIFSTRATFPLGATRTGNWRIDSKLR